MTAETDDQCGDCNDSMKVIVGSIGPEEAEDVAIPEEAGQGDHKIYGTEDHEIPLGEIVRAGGEQSSEAAEDVDEIVDRVDCKEEEHSIGDESCYTDNGEKNSEDFRERLNFSVEDTAGRGRHTEKGESGRKCSSEGRGWERKYSSACKGIMMQRLFSETKEWPGSA